MGSIPDSHIKCKFSHTNPETSGLTISLSRQPPPINLIVQWYISESQNAESYDRYNCCVVFKGWLIKDLCIK
jgi:hypothetical protein